MKSKLHAVLFMMLAGFGLIASMAVQAQGITACIDLAEKYQNLNEAAFDRAGPNNCQAFTEALSWADKALRQLRSCLPRAKRGKQAYHLGEAIKEMELGTKAARRTAILNFCIPDDYGTCKKQSGEIKIAACSRAISSGMWDKDVLAELFYSRGSEHERNGDYNRAIADYDQAIWMDSGTSLYYTSRCWARAIAGHNLHLVLEDCEQAVRLKPSIEVQAIAAREIRGFVYLRLNRLEDAIADYDAVLKFDPRLAGSLYGRGIAKLLKGDIVSGQTDIAAAQKAEKNIAERFAKYGIRPHDVTSEPAPTTALPPGADCARAETHWKSVEEIRTLAVYQDHLARYPNCDFAALAKARIEALQK